jgi:hypothetical protein
MELEDLGNIIQTQRVMEIGLKHRKRFQQKCKKGSTLNEPKMEKVPGGVTNSITKIYFLWFLDYNHNISEPKETDAGESLHLRNVQTF